MMGNCKLCGEEFYTGGYKTKVFCSHQHKDKWRRMYNKVYAGYTTGIREDIIREVFKGVETKPRKLKIQIVGTQYLKDLRMKRARLFLHFERDSQRQRIDELLEVYDLQEIKDIIHSR